MISTSDAYANVVAETRDWLTKAVIGLNPVSYTHLTLPTKA